MLAHRDIQPVSTMLVVHEGGRAIVGSVQGGAIPPTAPPLAIGQEQSAITMDDLIKPRELVSREGGS